MFAKILMVLFPPFFIQKVADFAHYSVPSFFTYQYTLESFSYQYKENLLTVLEQLFGFCCIVVT